MSLLLVAFIVGLSATDSSRTTTAPDAQSDEVKPRVFVTDSYSWESSGGWFADTERAGGLTRGGARPQTAEIMKTFRERCPRVTVTIDRSKADYVVLLDHEGGKGVARRDNKVAVFGNDGDLLYAGSTRSLGNAVKDACEAIQDGRLR